MTQTSIRLTLKPLSWNSLLAEGKFFSQPFKTTANTTAAAKPLYVPRVLCSTAEVARLPKLNVIPNHHFSGDCGGCVELVSGERGFWFPLSWECVPWVVCSSLGILWLCALGEMETAAWFSKSTRIWHMLGLVGNVIWGSEETMGSRTNEARFPKAFSAALKDSSGTTVILLRASAVFLLPVALQVLDKVPLVRSLL